MNKKRFIIEILNQFFPIYAVSYKKYDYGILLFMIPIYISDFAFLNDKAYFKALLVCLKAIELNQISLLAELDLKLVRYISNECHPIHVTFYTTCNEMLSI